MGGNSNINTSVGGYNPLAPNARGPAALAMMGVGGPQMALPAGLALLGQPVAARHKRMLRSHYGPLAESAALQQRQQSIASGTTGGAGFSAETQAYNQVMRQMGQAQQAFQQQQQGDQMAALQTVNQLAGMFAGGGFV